MVIREEPTPTIAVLGHFDPATQARLALLSRWLKDVTTTLRFISYSQSEQACERMAKEVTATLKPNILKDCSFIAIPRGGLIVLGQLSYLLGLRSEQLSPPLSKSSPLVVVDDCALSGSRFSRFLQECTCPQILFAPLYSHPDLRKAIVDQEPRVIGCVSAYDLKDLAPTRYGEDYPQWHKQATERMKSHRYWIGQTEEICFPWNEPDHNFWNPVTEQMEDCWRLFPPQRCLKNRLAAAYSIPVQKQSHGNGSLHPADDVIVGQWKSQIVLSKLTTKRSHTLEGTGVDFWHTLMDSTNLDTAIARLSKIYDAEREILKSDLEQFSKTLIDQGILTHDGP